MKLHVHHKESRKVGGNAPNNLITLCEDCHDLLHKGIVELPDDKKRRGKSSRDATFMGIMRKTLLQRLRDKTGIPIQNTYGYITKAIRESNGIEKTHTSDARCIARCPKAKLAAEEYLIKPVRRHNRRLHKNAILKGGYRKANQAPTFVFGFKLRNVSSMDEGHRARLTFDISTARRFRLACLINGFDCWNIPITYYLKGEAAPPTSEVTGVRRYSS